MKSFLIKWIVNIVALVTVVSIIPGISVDRWQTAVFAALVLGLANAFFRPLVILFTLPLNILSLGLFTLIINGFLFYLVSKLVVGFTVGSFWSAFWGALFFSVVSFLLNLFIGSQGKARITFYEHRPPRSSRYKEVIDANEEIKNKE